MTESSIAEPVTPGSAARETRGFQAEVKQLLQLMIHSLYSNKEIFLRELISNAADACDKLRFEAIARPELLEGGPELRIRVTVNEADRTINIADNGIGMTRDEVIANIGTIARSGTREFMASLSGDQARDANLIGQFGVGFYSGFIVADRVTLITRRAGDAPESAVRWESDGGGEFSIEPAVRAERGTEVILHLRSGEDDLLADVRIKTILRKYSDHIAIPIVMKKSEWSEEKKAMVSTGDDETVNQASALWARPRNDITVEQYHEFYKHIAHDFEPPLAYAHAKVEGRQDYTQLLFVPARAPFDMFDRQRRHGLKLYVRRVFIMDDAEQLLPSYLRFVRGVVDSSDLPLNVSREILQQSRDVDSIRAGCAKRVLGLLEELVENERDKFTKFWETFGAVFKEGVGEDSSNRDRIAKLLRFASTHSGEVAQTVSLADYVGRMKPEQEKIYYVTAESFAAAKGSPHLEVFAKKGIEVLLLGERVDEWVVGHLNEFDGKQMVSVAKGGLDLGRLEDEADKTLREAAAGDYKDVVERIKTTLGERVKDVRISTRLTESPACVVADDYDPSGNLQRILKSVGQSMPTAAPILEINPSHPTVQRLKYETDRFDDWAQLLLDQAVLAEGAQLEDPAAFVKRLNSLILDLSAGGRAA